MTYAAAHPGTLAARHFAIASLQWVHHFEKEEQDSGAGNDIVQKLLAHSCSILDNSATFDDGASDPSDGGLGETGEEDKAKGTARKKTTIGKTIATHV
jgi:hypothetical protein